MGIGIFTDKKVQPGEAEIRASVGAKWDAWCELVEFIRAHYPVQEDIKFLYGKNYGWALRFRIKSQVLTALYPTQGGFTSQVNLSEVGVQKARALATGRNVPKAIDTAIPYPEGRWLFIPIDTDKDLADVRELLALRAEEKRLAVKK